MANHVLGRLQKKETTREVRCSASFCNKIIGVGDVVVSRSVHNGITKKVNTRVFHKECWEKMFIEV